MQREEPVYAKLSYQVNGILFAVHNELGRFRNEQQYGDAVEYHLKQAGISYEREKVLPKSFAGESAGRNKVDFLIEDTVVVELKTKRVIDHKDYYQARRYLAALDKKLAILVNFRDKFLRPKRILNSSADV